MVPSSGRGLHGVSDNDLKISVLIIFLVSCGSSFPGPWVLEEIRKRRHQRHRHLKFGRRDSESLEPETRLIAFPQTSWVEICNLSLQSHCCPSCACRAKDSLLLHAYRRIHGGDLGRRSHHTCLNHCQLGRNISHSPTWVAHQCSSGVFSGCIYRCCIAGSTESGIGERRSPWKALKRQWVKRHRSVKAFQGGLLSCD